MKIVIDTNVIIKAARGKGISRKIFDLWVKGKFDLLISNSILLEYEEVLNRPKFDFPKWAVANLLYIFLKQASKVSPSQLHNVIIEDPDDNKFIDCALEGKAKYIITDDPHLLKLKEFESIKIVSPNKFLKIIK